MHSQKLPQCDTDSHKSNDFLLNPISIIIRALDHPNLSFITLCLGDGGIKGDGGKGESNKPTIKC